MGSKALFLFVKSASCACRCVHCSFDPGAPFEPLPAARTLALIRPFVELGDSGGLAVLPGDCPLNDPSLPEVVAYLREHDVEGWRSLAVNGVADRHADLAALRDAGTEFLEFTLYGDRETHDRFARRRGDHDRIHEIAAAWAALGGRLLWTEVLHKGNPGVTEHRRTLWRHIGRGARIEHLRPEAGEVDRLDEDARPEGEWRAELAGSAEAAYAADPAVVHLALLRDGGVTLDHHGDRIAHLPDDSAAVVLERWADRYAALAARYPPVRELARRYGDPEGRRLHDRLSIVRKWCARHDDGESRG